MQQEPRAHEAGRRNCAIDALCETVGGRPAPCDFSAFHEAGYVWTLLPRHGKRPVRFFGREMLRANDRKAAHSEHFKYWSDIQVFELHSGGFMTAVRHYNISEDRTSWHDTWFSIDTRSVILSLRNHGSAGVWPQAAQGSDVATRLRAWLGLVRATFGDTRAG